MCLLFFFIPVQPEVHDWPTSDGTGAVPDVLLKTQDLSKLVTSRTWNNGESRQHGPLHERRTSVLCGGTRKAQSLLDATSLFRAVCAATGSPRVPPCVDHLFEGRLRSNERTGIPCERRGFRPEVCGRARTWVAPRAGSRKGVDGERELRGAQAIASTLMKQM
jgi:hypothetical protein